MLPPEYKNMIISELYPLDGNEEHTIWSVLEGDKLEGSPVELLAKYEKQEIPNCTILARVETITEDPSGIGDMEGMGENQIGMLHHLVDGFASQMGLKVSYPSISVTPIAIYR
jgi:hypothetical protein